ncbi:MAG: Ldh family oxidoreductase [Victivallales bacterium]|nr:Ldh family oxidoreductase [Victivallales bacterium]
MSKISVDELKRQVQAISVASGIPEEDSAMLADVLVCTDMRGIHSHGVVRLARYLDCIKAGGVKPNAQPITLTESANSLQVSAAGGLGIPAAVKTMRRLMEKGKSQAISVATVNHSDHYGAAGYYSSLASDQGFLAFSMSNTCPLVAPTGGRAAAIGNNPFAYSAPGSKYRGVLFDICMSKVASGKIILAAGENKPIPEGWILTKEGKPTTDPNEIWRDAVMLPFAEHKGYGFAVMVEILTAVLGMSGLMSEVHSWNTTPGQDANTGHAFILINPAFLGGEAQFRTRIDNMIDELKACPPMDGVAEILYPGELEWRREASAKQDGIDLPTASRQELQRAARMSGVVL